MRTEFEFIDDIKSRYGLTKVGDDCAILPKDDDSDLLITSDMLVEGIDFRLDWSTPEQIGHKALAVSLSDIAAMGGTPTYAMLSVALVEKLWNGDFLAKFYAGWHQCAAEYGLELVGGDVSSTTGPLTVDSTALGIVPQGTAVLRSGAKVGDGIFVTNTLGAAAGGLEILSRGLDRTSTEAETLLKSLLLPVPQLHVAKALHTNGLLRACIDISDGLSSDLMHICGASRVGAEINADDPPIEAALNGYFPREECLAMALNGGEDFQLLFTGDGEEVAALGSRAITRIGTITANADQIELISGQKRTPIEARGYRHF